jgi:lipopolysaccharide export system permease protein
VILISFLSLFVTPWATNKVEDFRVQLESRDDLAAISPGVFKESAHADRVFFVESFDELGNVVKNIFVQSVQHQKMGIIVAAEGTRVVEKNGDNFLVMQNGHRYQGSRDKAEYSTTEFEKYAIRVEAGEAQRASPSTQAISSSELIQNKNNTNMAELQWRLAMPISALILALLAIPLSALDPRAGRSANFALAIIIYILYNNLLNIIQAWIAQGKINGIIGLWPIHMLFVILAFYLLYRRTLQLPFFPSISLPSWLRMPNKA